MREPSSLPPDADAILGRMMEGLEAEPPPKDSLDLFRALGWLSFMSTVLCRDVTEEEARDAMKEGANIGAKDYLNYRMQG